MCAVISGILLVDSKVCAKSRNLNVIYKICEHFGENSAEGRIHIEGRVILTSLGLGVTISTSSNKWASLAT